MVKLLIYSIRNISEGHKLSRTNSACPYNEWSPFGFAKGSFESEKIPRPLVMLSCSAKILGKSSEIAIPRGSLRMLFNVLMSAIVSFFKFL